MAQVIPFEERAVATLRDRLGAAESAKQDLIAYARGHSGATAAIHGAVLALMDAGSLEAMFETVTVRWPMMLGIDEVTLALVADGKGFRVGRNGTWTVEPRIVDRAIERVEPATMRSVGCGHPLFGSAAKGIRSEVLVILDADAPLPYGLLLLGQSKEAVIDGKHGTELMGFLGAALGAMLRRWLVNP
ncbi:DUF484 family protein [Sphingomonas jaspsi]|uniref:DUF484 family protein n=1 Tax=Sphingomonas jaspsi TaxID=392409 RepID=UPI0004B39D9D|nr:DUF484 family protein [Sphingomonas jaspsi]